MSILLKDNLQKCIFPTTQFELVLMPSLMARICTQITSVINRSATLSNVPQCSY